MTTPKCLPQLSTQDFQNLLTYSQIIEDRATKTLLNNSFAKLHATANALATRLIKLETENKALREELTSLDLLNYDND